MRPLSLIVSLFLFTTTLFAGERATALAVLPGGAVLTGSPSGVQRSTDGGRSWKLVFEPGDEPLVVASIAVDPLATSNVFVATSRGLFRSSDGGVTFGSEDLLGGSTPGAIVFEPGTSAMYVATADGLYASTDHGAKWKAINPNGSTFSVRALAMRDKPFALFLVNEEGLFSSSDRGASWQRLTDERDDLSGVAFQAPSTLHVAANGARYFRSNDGGKTWEKESHDWPHFTAFQVIGDAAYALSDTAAWRTRDLGATWQKLGDESAFGAIIAEKNRRTLWATSNDGALIKSTDGGDSWSAASTGSAQPVSNSAR